MIYKNVIVEILFAYCTVKISYRKNFHVYGIRKASYLRQKDTVLAILCTDLLIIFTTAGKWLGV